jgi:ubiquinone/menaquinone biosynthesis C-methylase UbiE
LTEQLRPQSPYIMESEKETLRLERKTDVSQVVRHAKWAGIQPGMRVADVGCGAGVTSSVLFDLVKPGGSVVGVDMSEERVRRAETEYGREGVSFQLHDVSVPFDMGEFDFVWVRFLLEYFRKEVRTIIENIGRLVRPGGVLCLVDLDMNSMNYWGLTERLERNILRHIHMLQEHADFDPYAGRKLYGHMYSLGYEHIRMDMVAHHLIFGPLKTVDEFNWLTKMKTLVSKIPVDFSEYEDGFSGFEREFEAFLKDPSRFIYTPAILCCGVKPVR